MQEEDGPVKILGKMNKFKTKMILIQKSLKTFRV